MDLKDVFCLIRKRVKILIVITLIATITSGILNVFVMEKIYQCKLTLMISAVKQQEDNGGLEYDDILLGEKLVDTYGIIAKSDRVMDKVIRRLNLSISSKQLQEKITVHSQPEKRIIEVTLEDTSSTGVYQMANAFLETFQSETENFFHMNNVRPIGLPKRPTTPARPNMILNLLISIFGGIISGLFFIFIVESLDNKIGDVPKIENKIGIPVLARLSKDRVTSAGPTVYHSKEYIRVITDLDIMNKNLPCQSILIASTKASQDNGEIIKDLSMVMAQLGKKVLVIDGDFKTPILHQTFNIENKEGLVDILGNTGEYKINRPTNVWTEVRPQDTPISYFDDMQFLPRNILRVIPTGIVEDEDYQLLLSKKLGRFLNAMENDYEIIIVNGGVISSKVESLPLIRHSDAILLIEHYGQSTFEQIEDTLRKLGSEKSKVKGMILRENPKERK